jgi:hypothetical protein
VLHDDHPDARPEEKDYKIDHSNTTEELVCVEVDYCDEEVAGPEMDANVGTFVFDF